MVDILPIEERSDALPFDDDVDALDWLASFTRHLFERSTGRATFDTWMHSSYRTLLNGELLSRDLAWRHFSDICRQAATLRYAFLSVRRTEIGLDDHHVVRIDYRDGRCELWGAMMSVIFSQGRIIQIEEIAALLWSGHTSNADEADLIMTRVEGACNAMRRNKSVTVVVHSDISATW